MSADLEPKAPSPSMVRTTVRTTLVYAIPTFLTKGLAFLLLPIYARALQPSDYGVVDLVGSLGPIIHILICVEVLQGMVRLRVDMDSKCRARLTGTTWLFSIGMHLLFQVIALPNAESISNWVLGDPTYSDAAVAGIVSISATSLVNLFMSQYRWELRSVYFSVLSTGYAVTTIGLAALMALVLDYGVTGILVGQVLAGSIFIVISLALAGSSVTWTFDADLLRQMMKFSWPLVASSLTVMLTLSFNRIALTALTDLEQVGIFGMAVRLASITSILVAALQMAVTPLVYQHYRDPLTPASLAKLFRWTVAALMVVCLALHLLAETAVQVIAPGAYAPAAQLIPLLAPAMLLQQLYVFTPGMAIAKKTWMQLIVTSTSAVVSLAANLLLVPLYGALGAALATLCAAIVFFGAWAALSQRLYPLPYDVGPLVGGVMLYITLTAGAFWVDASSLGDNWLWAAKASILLVLASGLVTLGLIRTGEIQNVLVRRRPQVSSP